MKLSKKSEAEVMLVYNAYWDNYLKGDVEAMIPLLDDGYTQVGSAETEVFINKKDAVKFLNDTIDQVAGKLEMRNRSTKLEQQDTIILLHELCDVYVLTDKEWNFYSKFRASTLIQKKEMGWKIIHQHSSMPDIRTQEGENIAIEKISKENLELREAVKRRTIELEHKNRDLEIEAALERVRAQAMGMKKPDDLMDICEILFAELQALGFHELRNTMINIYNDDKSSFLNYDFSTNAGKTVIVMSYNFHPLIEKQVRITKSASDAFFEFSFSGKELKDFRELRKKNAELDDPKLEDTSSLHYYFYSIGTGSIGISTYSSITEEKLNLLKRFRNVFDFAYRRYVDVSQAVEQAKEARLEASLERVRAQAMSMRKSEELSGVSEIIFAELKSLGFTELRNTEIIINNDANETVISHYYSDYGVTGVIEVFYKNHPTVKGWVEEMQKANDGFAAVTISENEMDAWRKYREEIGYLPDPKLNASKVIYYYSYATGLGALSVSTFKPINDEQLKILERFRNVFGLAYRRYADVTQAEAQAREAKIEASLERVRARSLAMHQSEELVDASTVLFNELKKLEIETIRTGVGIVNPINETVEIWSSELVEKKENRILGVVPVQAHPFFEGYYSAWKKKYPYFFMHFAGEEVEQFYKKISAFLSYPNRESFNPKESIYIFFFPEGSLNVVSHHPLTEDECKVMVRFARVFGLIYTRFLDLKHAEAQAREAKIEAAMERVRSRTMAMQHSDELQEAASLLFQQVKTLGVPTGSCGYNVWDKEEKVATAWMSSPDGDLQAPFKFSHTGSPHLQHIYAARQRGEDFLAEEVSGEALIKHFNYLMELPVIGDTIKGYVAAGIRIPEKVIYHTVFFNQGYLSFHTHELSTGAWDLFKRFGKVFEQTYTRFLDLQKAEAQAREAQIELGLERVRARTMAMQKSEELKEVIQVVYEQFVHLNILIEHTGFIIDYKARDDMHIWLADRHEVPSEVTIPYFDCAHWNSFNEAKEKGMDFFANQLSFEEKNRFYQDLFKLIPGLTEEAKEFYFSCPGLAASTVLLENVGLYIENFSGIPYTDEENNTLMRFGKVFQQTYTRFLDLQKAEAQAREAQIEAGLERVRSRAMSMHKTNELLDAAELLSKELSALGIISMNVSYAFVDEEEKYGNYYGLNPVDGKMLPFPFVFPHTETEVMRSLLSSWKKQEPYHVIELDEKATLQHQTYIGEHIQKLITKNNINIPFSVEAFLAVSPKTAVIYSFNFTKGYLFNIGEGRLTNMQEEMVLRFTKVFEMTYRRFLDLKTAEAQAREAQIELALERVRARTMAMYRSDELAETAYILFQQFTELGQAPEQITIGIVNETERVLDLSLTMHGKKIDQLVKVSLDEPIVIHKIYEAWKKQNKTLILDLSGKELQDYNQYKNSIRSGSVKSDYQEEHRVIHIAFFSKGILSISTPEPRPPETTRLLERFAGVFDLTYTRFLDLKQAEAQTREAKIEAALEKVRGRAMAMHNSNDLSATASIVFSELGKLGIHPVRSGVGLLTKVSHQVLLYAATASLESDTLALVGPIDMSGNPCLKMQYESCLKKENYFPILSGEALKSYYKELAAQISVPSLTEEQFRHEHYGYYFSFSEGYFYAWTENAYSEDEINILNRFKAIVDLTFLRYLDLQKAEAQTREAQIEAGLERVRSRTLAMHSSDELAETAAVVFKQLINLGIAPNRLYIAIIKDENSNSEFWITDEDGSKVSSGFSADLNANATFQKMLAGWKEQKKSIVIDMQGKELEEYFNQLTELHVPFKGGLSQKRRVQNIAYFSQGFVGIASPDLQPEETEKLLERFASVFNLTYTRFNDLKLAEAQAINAQVEEQKLREEKKRSDSLLLNILPEEIANELKQFGKSYARKHDEVTVLFADIKGFSTIAENLSAEELVNQLDECFRAFDHIVEKHGLEKIKTVGDAYLCACGLPKPVTDNAAKAVKAALDMMDFIKGFAITKTIQDLPAFEFRIGIHTGPVITGVVGLKKFTYDIWGDAVNMAARMEQHGEPGKINVSGNTYRLIKDKFTCTHRGKIQAKNKGEVDMYFVESIL